MILRLFSAFLLISVVLTSGCAQPYILDLSKQTHYSFIQSNRENPDFIILDVRTPDEWKSEHIENAINIDLFSRAFREELEQLDKSRTYLVYCLTGNRSGKALRIMKDMDFKNVYKISGGFLKWKKEGLPTVK